MDSCFDPLAIQSTRFMDAVQSFDLLQPHDVSDFFRLQGFFHIRFIGKHQHRCIVREGFIFEHCFELGCGDIEPHPICSVHYEDDSMNF